MARCREPARSPHEHAARNQQADEPARQKLQRCTIEHAGEIATPPRADGRKSQPQQRYGDPCTQASLQESLGDKWAANEGNR